MAEPTDFEIMLHVQGRMPQALTLLQQRYQSRLLGLCRSWGCSREHSSQIVQRVWTFVWKHADQFDLERERSVAVWLYDLTAFYTQAFVTTRRQMRWQWLWAGLGVALLGGIGGVGFSFYPALRQWGTSFARSWVGSPDVAALERSWRQSADTQIFPLLGAAGTTPLEGLWSPEHRQMILVAPGIPTPPPGHTYQLWAVSWQTGATTSQAHQVVESGGTWNGTPPLWLSNTLLSHQPQRLLITQEKLPGSLRPGTMIVWDSAPAAVETGSN